MMTLAAGIFVVVIEFAVAPEKRAEFVAVSAEQAPAVRELEGNLQFDVLVDETRPNIVAYVERWETQAQQEAFYEWWARRGLIERLRPLVTAAPKVSSFRQAVD
jgi:quinol monooxygenase YgiN